MRISPDLAIYYLLSGSADDGGDDGDDGMQRGSARPVHSRDSRETRDSLPPRKKKESLACAHL
jgi:hypothetical protein